MIGYQNNLNSLVQRSHIFGPSSSTKNDTATLQPVISDTHVKQKTSYECCIIIGHKSDACIICGLTSSHTVVEDKLNSSTQFMVINQLIHRDNVTANLHQLTSNTGNILGYHGETKSSCY